MMAGMSPKQGQSTGKMNVSTEAAVMWEASIAQRFLAGIFGSRDAVVGCVKLMRWYFWAMVLLGFVPKDAYILVARLFIIDWYHGLEHIWDCGKVLFGEGSEATEKWMKRRESWLWNGQTRKLLNDMHKQHRSRKRKELAGLYKYIRDNEQKMRYEVSRAKGYDIGSGAVEGACKFVVGPQRRPGHNLE